MDFFERQRAARGTSVRLVLLFALAVLCIVAVNDLVVFIIFRGEPAGTIIGWIIAVSIITLLIIGCGTASKLVALRAGGAAVAQSVGATAIDPSTRDPRLRRFINVVEEMSIASGVPVPRLFVLEQESSINAFAAGYSPADAAITVTSGALDKLNRDELQGVIGHEFSHVLNGDMRLNVRLIGLLNGILLLGLVGLRFLQFGGRSRDRAGAALLAVAIAMIVLGFVGQFFAGLIQAAVGRQREWLADASSVQFTRQTNGLVGALKKIAGLPAGSALRDKRGAKQVSHVLFGEGTARLNSLYATHPPLEERIAALDPTVTPEQIAELMHQFAEQPPDGLAEDAAMGLVGPGEAAPARPAPRQPSVQVQPAELVRTVGTLTADDLTRGAALSRRIPPSYRTLAEEQSNATALVLALVIDTRPEVQVRQLRAVGARLGDRAAVQVRTLAEQLEELDPILRLPVVALAVPGLVSRPPADRVALQTVLDELARADASISVFEYCLIRLIGTYLLDAEAPVRRSRPGRAAVTGMQDAALNLLAAVAAAGNDDRAAAERAFRAGLARLLPGTSLPFAPPTEPWRTLDAGWAALDALDARNKQVLIESLVVAVRDDGVLTVSEAELLRTTCALLHCPLPPLIG